MTPYKVGQLVQIKHRVKEPEFWDGVGVMLEMCDQIHPIKKILKDSEEGIHRYQLDEPGGWVWGHDDLELIEQSNNPNILFRFKKDHK